MRGWKAQSTLQPKGESSLEEETEVTDVTNEIVKDANIERFFSYDLEVVDEGFYCGDEENLMGAVVHLDAYLTHETLVSIFDDLLIKAVMQTQAVDEDEASELIRDYEDEDDYPD